VLVLVLEITMRGSPFAGGSQFTAQSSRLTIRGFAGCGLQLRSVKNYKPVNNATTVVSERVNFVWMLVAFPYVNLLFTRFLSSLLIGLRPNNGRLGDPALPIGLVRP